MGDLVPCDKELIYDPRDDRSVADSDCSQETARELQPACSSTFGKVNVHDSNEVHVGTKIVFVLNNSDGKQVSRILGNAQDLNLKDPSACGALFARRNSHFDDSAKTTHNSSLCYIKLLVFLVIALAITSLALFVLYSKMFGENNVTDTTNTDTTLSGLMVTPEITEPISTLHSVSTSTQSFNDSEEISLTTINTKTVPVTTKSYRLSTMYTTLNSSDTSPDENESSELTDSTEPSTLPSTAQPTLPSTAQSTLSSTAQSTSPSNAQSTLPSTAQSTFPSTAPSTLPSTAQLALSSTISPTTGTVKTTVGLPSITPPPTLSTASSTGPSIMSSAAPSTMSSPVLSTEKSIVPPDLKSSSTFTPTELLSSTIKQEKTDPPTSTTSQQTVCFAHGAVDYFPLITKPTIIIRSDVNDGVCLVRPSQWDSVSCGMSCAPFTTVSSVTIHFLDTCQNFKECSALVKMYESDFSQRTTDPKKDFLFNFVIGADSRIYEGLGWDSLVTGSETIHIGIQFWDSSYNVSTKQMYLLMLLFSVGRWCGKINNGPSLSYVCLKECARYFTFQRYLRLMVCDKYLLDTSYYFIIDSKDLGTKFTECDGHTFDYLFTLCDSVLC